MTREDFPLVSIWLDEPHVRQWWPGEETDPRSLERKYGPRIDGIDPTEMFVIDSDARPVGMIQRYRVEDYPDWARTLAVITDVGRAAGIDYLIGEPDAVNQGLGTAAIRAFVPTVFHRWPVASIVVAVQQHNLASWRALARCGFDRIWAGTLESDDPSDAGPSFVYCRARPA